MRTAEELQEKVEHLTEYKEILIGMFSVMELPKQKHSVLAAFYSTVDNEIAMLRWALGQIEETWSDDLSQFPCMETYFDALPPTEFPWRPAPLTFDI